MINAVESASLQFGLSSTNADSLPFDIPELPDIDRLEEIVPRRWMYRHWSSDGDIHVRSVREYFPHIL